MGRICNNCNIFYANPDTDTENWVRCPKCGGRISHPAVKAAGLTEYLYSDNTRKIINRLERRSEDAQYSPTDKDCAQQSLPVIDHTMSDAQVQNRKNRNAVPPTPVRGRNSGFIYADETSQTPVRPRKNEYSGNVVSIQTSNADEPHLDDRLSAVLHGTHSGSTRHTVTFIDEYDHQTYHTIYYGEYRRNSNIPQHGSRIIVRGRPHGDTFFTEDVYAGGRRIHLRSQYGRGQSNPLPFIVIALIIIAVILIMRLFSSDLFEILKAMVVSLLVTFVISFIIIYAILTSFIGNRMRRFRGLTAPVSAVVAFLIAGSVSGIFGAGGDVILSTILTCGIIIVILIVMFDNLLR